MNQNDICNATEFFDNSLEVTLVETTAETEELEEIGKLLIGSCCNKTCLLGSLKDHLK